MKKTRILSAFIFFSTVSSFGLATTAANERTPFTDILFDAKPSVKVEVQGEILYLLQLNGVKREDLMARCEATFGPKCPCALAESFTETMNRLQIPIGPTVSLQLYRMADHQIINLDQVPATEENQIQLLFNRESRGEACSN